MSMASSATYVTWIAPTGASVTTVRVCALVFPGPGETTAHRCPMPVVTVSNGTNRPNRTITTLETKTTILVRQFLSYPPTVYVILLTTSIPFSPIA